jgi:NAD(P)-dependent dehydrogenase (short-subunit alcohol dehydrogenase family)
MKRVLITGANGGLGKESARQLASQAGIEKIYLGCRNPERAEAAKKSLEQVTGKKVFEVLTMDVSNLASVRSAVAKLDSPIDGLIMNAGGMGSRTPGQKIAAGATMLFATNVLGHAVLVEELLKENKLTGVAVYAGSEAARGLKKMGMKRPTLKTSSVDEFKTIIDGSYWNNKVVSMEAYGPVKYVGNLWISALARKHPEIRFVTMSPGGTSGTEVMNDLPPFMRYMFKYVGIKVMTLFGMVHSVDVGAQRYLSALNNSSFKSGHFYGSEEPSVTGPLVDQSTIFSDIADAQIQDNAYAAIQQYIE